MVPFPHAATHLLYPDWGSLKCINYGSKDPLYAAVMCRVVEEIPGRSAPNMDLCPRRTLMEIVKKAQLTHGLNFLVGVEIEFFMMQDSGQGDLLPQSSHTGHYSVAGVRESPFRYVEEMVKNLRASGVSVQGFHIEGYQGQYEIFLAPHPPMQAIDELVTAHDIIKGTLASHGLIATMLPKPVPDRSGSGPYPYLHDRFSSARLVLGRNPAATACNLRTGLPYDYSYTRVQELEAGNTVCWGTENRGVPVRKIENAHWEIRCADATANMYLAVAAIIVAGLLGIQSKEILHWQDASGEKCGDTSADAAERLPENLDQALKKLRDACHEWEEFLGSKVFENYLSLKRQESETLRRLDDSKVKGMLVKLF